MIKLLCSVFLLSLLLSCQTSPQTQITDISKDIWVVDLGTTRYEAGQRNQLLTYLAAKEAIQRECPNFFYHYNLQTGKSSSRAFRCLPNQDSDIETHLNADNVIKLFELTHGRN